MRVSRRDLLAGAGAIAGAAGSKGCKPEGDSGEELGPATIDTIVIVMMENRSFDHMLGALKLEGRTDVNGITPDMSNPDENGDPVSVYPNEIDCVEDPHHGWSSSHDQFNNGANDGFVTDFGGPAVMQYMVREDLPIYYAMADNFAVCDNYFCAVLGPTWPNRFYGHCGTSLGMTSNDFPDGGSYTIPNVWERLTEAGVEWGYYYTDLPFAFLIEGVFDPKLPRMFEHFVAHAEAGALPSVVWLDPAFSFNDDHPPHHVASGQEFIAAVYRALANSPHWNNCLLLITYDEHGGFWDHVPPPTTSDDHAAEGFDQLGFRVPMLAIGPYVKQGVVSTQFDHTSWLKLLCDRYGIEPWTARIAAANSIAAVLDEDRMARRDPMPPAELPAFDYPDDDLPKECRGGGIVGPEAPPSSERTRGPAANVEPVLPETWHHLMKAVYREDERTGEWKRIAEWIRAYNRSGRVPTILDR